MYYEPTFFSTLRNNFNCLFCRQKKNCNLKYTPGRRKRYSFGGNRYIELCPKVKEKYLKKLDKSMEKEYKNFKKNEKKYENNY